MAALRRVQRNDPMLTHLLICEPPTTVQREGPHFAHIDEDGPALKRLFDLIGNNTHLQDVCFDTPLGLADAVATSEHFDGLKRNESILSLGLSRCNILRGVGLETLRAFAENHRRLTKFTMWHCGIPFGSQDALASMLKRCACLEEVSLTCCQIDDRVVEILARAMGGKRRLRKLDLQENNIGSKGCEALAALVKDPECGLTKLNLRNNCIDDAGATAMANALPNNEKLETIHLDRNFVSVSGWSAFSRVLCDPSSVNATYRSNHTLRSIVSYDGFKLAGSRMYDEGGAIPSKLFSLVECNARGCLKGGDRGPVAREKILDCHLGGDDFDMGPFVEGSMDSKVLPHVLGWIGRRSDGKSCAAMFNLLRRMPELCEDDAPVEGFDETPRSDEAQATAGRKAGGNIRRKSKLYAIVGTVRSMRKVIPFSRKWKQPSS